MAKVLVVEDSVFMRQLIVTILSGSGHEVVEAGDGQKGLEKFGLENPDCLVTDLLMPIMDGLEMIREIRASGWQGPAVVVSADIQATTRQQCLDLGVHEVLPKPPEQERLVRTVEAALDTMPAAR